MDRFGRGANEGAALGSKGLHADQVVYVGDEVRDIKAARQAGVAMAAVTWGFHRRELLAPCRPDYLLERPEELLRKGCLASLVHRVIM